MPPPTSRSSATPARRCGEVALYAEFGFEGALIANNTVDGAAIGVSVTNFNEGGRLAVVQGNIIRNLLPNRAGRHRSERRRRHRHRRRGRHRGHRQRDRERADRRHHAGLGPLSARRRRHRQRGAQADIGIAVSVAAGAGTAVIANNVIAGARRGAIVGMDGHAAVTGDLAGGGAALRPPHDQRQPRALTARRAQRKGRGGNRRGLGSCT